ncbi:hypothetical protein BGZ73_003313 [Actinomortierella ambigua]|nr:hypothetical protein BGZ73_003313 [Actinomortierella ambigua]
MESSPVNPSPIPKQSFLVLGAKLGSGGFGDVRQARWGNQPCAAKMFFLSESDFQQKSIQQEIAVLQRLRHRHIIQFYRTHEEDGRIYLLMELAEKGSLAHAISKGTLGRNDWETKLRLADEIARGLTFIHQEKIVHRDLKSANVLLTKHMEVKLADFGLAQVKSMTTAMSKTSAHSSLGVAGTLRWVAPELLFSKKRVYSTKSDVYALAMVMWEMAASSTRPFQDQYDDSLVALDVKSGRREELPDDTPAEYRAWVERCWDMYPARSLTQSTVVADDDGPTLDFTFSSTDLFSQDLGSPGFGDNATERKGVVEKVEDDYVGRLPQTEDDVVTYICSAAKRGNADAQLFLGWIFGQGQGVHKSDKDSLWWYRQSAENGHVAAQFRLGKIYAQGHGMDASDVAKATMWYKKAADGGSAEAQLTLAEMYADGNGVKQDTVEAARWYRMAAYKGRLLLGSGILLAEE